MNPQISMRGDDQVAAVFATMNRPETAVRCIRALAGQTRVPDLVVVALNAPGDGTREALRAEHSLPFRLELHEMADNGGNAGGIKEAVQIAMAHQQDLVWILDDDSWPRPSALGCLLTGMAKGERFVTIPLQIDPGTNDIAWPLVVLGEDGKGSLVQRLSDLPVGSALASRPSWTGTLYPVAALREAGPIKGELFIRGEDEEYPFRVAQAGWRFRLCPEAILDHPGPKALIHRRILGRNFFWEPDLPDWKMYYKVRNLVWMKKTRGQFAGVGAVIMCWVGCWRHDQRSSHRWKVFMRAVADGWRGRLGRVAADWAP